MVCQRELHKDWFTRLSLPAVPDVDWHRADREQHACGHRSAVQERDRVCAHTDYRIEAQADEWIGKKYRQSVVAQPMVELALGLYFTATVFYALANGIYGTIPFLMLFQIGFLYTGLLSVV